MSSNKECGPAGDRSLQAACQPASTAPEVYAAMTAVCGSCEAPVSEEMDRTIRRLLGSLDRARHDRLATLHGGTAPNLLCPDCFLPTIGTLNRTAVSADR